MLEAAAAPVPVAQQPATIAAPFPCFFWHPFLLGGLGIRYACAPCAACGAGLLGAGFGGGGGRPCGNNGCHLGEPNGKFSSSHQLSPALAGGGAASGGGCLAGAEAAGAGGAAGAGDTGAAAALAIAAALDVTPDFVGGGFFGGVTGARMGLWCFFL